MAYLKTGHNRFSAASGPMAEAVMDSTSRLTDDDLKAIATYLKDRPVEKAVEEAVDLDADVIKTGSAIYAIKALHASGARLPEHCGRRSQRQRPGHHSASSQTTASPAPSVQTPSRHFGHVADGSGVDHGDGAEYGLDIEHYRQGHGYEFPFSN